jgi:two-component system sensor histidine kinase KdpD
MGCHFLRVTRGPRARGLRRKRCNDLSGAVECGVDDGKPAVQCAAVSEQSLSTPADDRPDGRGRLGGGREYLEVVAAITAVTVAAWFVPLDYRVFGDVYLLTVIALSLRVGPWPVVFAAIVSVLAWNYVIVPPRMSFSRLDLKDGVFLGTYFFAALLAGQLTARIRAQERRERQRERRATTLFHLTRALAAARTRDEAVEAALRQADAFFAARTAVLLEDAAGEFVPHPASSLRLGREDGERAALVARSGEEPPRRSPAECVLIPLARPGAIFGVLAVGDWAVPAVLTFDQREILQTFAAQLALVVERDRLRVAGEREKVLAESDRLHRTLLDSVSHELKTPIAVLRSAAENLANEDGARRRTLADEVRTATDRLDRVVGNLLNQSRLEAGALNPQIDWCDARDIVGAARRAGGAALASRTVAVEIPADMPLIKADMVLMEQAVANLLLNAVRHTPAGVPITVTAGRDAVRQRVFLAVADQGPGIAAELRGRLFQKFQRGPEAHAGGLGLGLSIVRGFMHAQGGEVVVDEPPGGGARFTLYLPHTPHENVPHE